MGEAAEKLHRRMSKKASKRRPDESLAGRVKDVKTFIKKEGLNPICAAYAFTQSLTSLFAESVSHFPEMKAWAKDVADAENEYMPLARR